MRKEYRKRNTRTLLHMWTLLISSMEERHTRSSSCLWPPLERRFRLSASKFEFYTAKQLHVGRSLIDGMVTSVQSKNEGAFGLSAQNSVLWLWGDWVSLARFVFLNFERCPSHSDRQESRATAQIEGAWQPGNLMRWTSSEERDCSTVMDAQLQ